LTYRKNYEFPVLIDSTGLPNRIKVEQTHPSNLSGVISNEIRLIFIVDYNTGLPIFYKTISGNITDITTLKTTINILSMYDINVKFILMDAGYYSLDNLKFLHELGISFLSRIKPNDCIYKNLVKQHAMEMMLNSEYVIKHNQRYLYCK
jgi:transposase